MSVGVTQKGWVGRLNSRPGVRRVQSGDVETGVGPGSTLLKRDLLVISKIDKEGSGGRGDIRSIS